MADIDFEETNRIRVALGMQPLPIPGASSGPVFKPSKNTTESGEDEPASTLETRQALASDNWQRLQDEADAKAKRQRRKDEIKKAKDKEKRFGKLEGKGLGEDDASGEPDTKAWLQKHNKRQKKIRKARKLEEELAAREKEQLAEYTSVDLAGVNVGHELDQFEDGADQVLTLKDAAVDDEDVDDELENLDMREEERLNERLAAKKRTFVYNPNDVDENESKSILAHYDEEIEGKKGKRFTLDGKGSSKQHQETLASQQKSSKPTGMQISLDMLQESTTVSDYKGVAEVKIRKPKKGKDKNKSKKRRRVEEEPDEADRDNMDVDMQHSDHVTIFDDEDLHAGLAQQRRAALKKRRKNPLELLDQMRGEEEDLDDSGDVVMQTNEDDDEPGLVIDETSEFIANLQRPTTPDRKAKRDRSAEYVSRHSPDSDDEDVRMREADHSRDDSQVSDLKKEASGDPGMSATGLDEEATLNEGLGATFSMLRQRGLLKTIDTGDANAVHRERQRFLAEKHRREDEAERRARTQRERDRQSGKLDRMTAREREDYARDSNTRRDQQESRQMADVFNREYKPEVELKYFDEYKRPLNAKEAFKHLSHQFHGKGSGKGKTEKRLKKIENEKKAEAMSTLDSSQHTHMNSAMGATARRKGQAGVRLQ